MLIINIFVSLLILMTDIMCHSLIFLIIHLEVICCAPCSLQETASVTICCKVITVHTFSQNTFHIPTNNPIINRHKHTLSSKIDIHLKHMEIDKLSSVPNDLFQHLPSFFLPDFNPFPQPCEVKPNAFVSGPTECPVLTFINTG